MDSETSSQAGEAMVVKVPAATAKGGDGPASFNALEEVHNGIWAQSRAAPELKHWELADGLLLELRGISMKFLDMHKASLSPEEERYGVEILGLQDLNSEFAGWSCPGARR